jgi:hypothetical protein
MFTMVLFLLLDGMEMALVLLIFQLMKLLARCRILIIVNLSDMISMVFMELMEILSLIQT